TGAGRDQTSIAKRKREILRKLIEREQPKNAIIFCNRKRDVDVVYKSLERHGYNTAARLHGDMVQSVRMETLSKFKSGDVTLLVCSDVAARGLDIPAMSHVFNFDVPTHADDYVHRIGRTGRAGREGVAISIAVPSDGKYVDAIEKLMGRSIDQDPMSSTGGGSGSSGGGDDTASAPEKPEKEARSERGRGRGRDRGRSRKPASDDTKAEPAADAAVETTVNAEPVKDAPKTETPAAEEPAAKPSRARRSRSDQRNDAGAMDDKDVVFGQSDQVPAFLKNF
ncbi:MAG: helicase C-terminal domain-containing protein, partial [Alphaproteobacteria bacterium]